jgi:hypothetical protein
MMPSAHLARAALSAAAVGVLLLLLRRSGPRAGGLVAAVPVNSMPALFWLWMEHGAVFASRAALGSLWCTGLAALAGLGFAHLARTRTFVSHAGLPHMPNPRARRTVGPQTPLQSMAVAGAMSLFVSALAQHAGPQLCGMIAALPLVAMFALHAGHRQGGSASMLLVLGGYLEGLLAKAAFLGALSAAWAEGAGGWAWPLALAVAALFMVGRHGVLKRPRISVVKGLSNDR